MQLYKIGIIGGTGHEGAGLGFRWAAVGHEVILGSRTEEKGAAKAAELREKLPPGAKDQMSGTDNLTAVQNADIIVLSVPYSAQEKTLLSLKEALAGKIVVTVVVPLQPPKVSHVWSPPGGSAAEEAQALLGEEVPVVAAFQNVSATHLLDLSHAIDCDVLVCGNKRDDRRVALNLVEAAGMRGVDSGPLVNARVAEGLTAMLIGINIRNKIKNAGIRITGLA